MDPETPAHAGYRLQRYERSIAAMKAYFEEPGAGGRFFASEVYREKAMAESCLKKLQENERSRLDLLDKLDRLNRNLAGLEQVLGRNLSDKLLGELRYYLDSYHAGTCFMAMGAMGPEDVAEVAPLDIIRILAGKLQNDYDFADLRQILRELDVVSLSMKEEMGRPGEKSPVAGSAFTPGECRCRARETIREE